MTVRISVRAKDGSRIEVSVGATSCMRVEIVSDRARVVVGDDAGASLRVSMTGRSRSEDAERARGGSGAGTVSAEMEAAAVRAFLGAADATRLGRSLTNVYLAMDAVRRGQGGIEDDDGA